MSLLSRLPALAFGFILTAPALLAAEAPAAADAAAKKVDESLPISKQFQAILTEYGYQDLTMQRRLTIFVVGMLISMILARLIRHIIENHLKKLTGKTTSDLDDLVCDALGYPISLLITSTGVWLSLTALLIDTFEGLQKLTDTLFHIAIAVSVAWAIYRMVTIAEHYLLKMTADTEGTLDDLVAEIAGKLLRVIVVFLALLFIGQNILGFDITTLLAGAGVAGLAVAFAAQDTIANFFGSIMLLLDRPFQLNDTIKVSGFTGTVEEIGLRSTKIRTADGHLVSLPNKSVANDQIENVAERSSVRTVFNLDLTYDTTPAQMQQAITILGEIFAKHEGFKSELPPKFHFTEFKTYSLALTAVVWYHGKDYWTYMDWKHKMNMEILRRFNDAGLKFAFPTTTLDWAGPKK